MDFSDFVQQGIALLSQRDVNSWALGDLAALFEVTVGRPSEDDDTPTLGDLAQAWNVSGQRVSEWRNVARFYPTELRTFEVPWEMYNAARRASDDIEDACALLAFAEKHHLGINAFRRHLKGIRWEGAISKYELPLRLQGMMPDYEKKFWIVIKRFSGDES